MIPPDLASRLRFVTTDLPAAPQPVTSARQLTDVLSELSAGQKIFAEIQALLPNGAYRAVISQREITLALPFSAKPGDTLELEVQESDGKLSLAFVANRSAPNTGNHSNESVSTTLSKTGNLIGNLLSGIDQSGGRPKPVQLNANQPLIDNLPENPADLAPILKESLIKSGMFYESHQASWIEGKLSTATLLQEPQGKLSRGGFPSAMIQTAPFQETTIPKNSDIPSQESHLTPIHITQGDTQGDTQEIPGKSTPFGRHDYGNTESIGRENIGPLSNSSVDGNNSQRLSSPIHPDLTPIVQQQLNALATQTYVWQGQVWPGQNMHWEITQEDSKQAANDPSQNTHWQTRLNLQLPLLGNIEATLRLGTGGNIELSLVTETESSTSKLQLEEQTLQHALENTGLKLTNFAIKHGEINI